MIERIESVVIGGGEGYTLIQDGIYVLRIVTASQFAEGQAILHIHEVITETSRVLYGFMDISEREVFRMLISVSGIGATTAMTVLSGMGTQGALDAIKNENVSAFKAVKGIGAKTASQIILDLAKKLKVSVADFTQNELDAIAGLSAFGYTKTESKRLVSEIKMPNNQPQDIIVAVCKNK